MVDKSSIKIHQVIFQTPDNYALSSKYQTAQGVNNLHKRDFAVTLVHAIHCKTNPIEKEILTENKNPIQWHQH